MVIKEPEETFEDMLYRNFYKALYTRITIAKSIRQRAYMGRKNSLATMATRNRTTIGLLPLGGCSPTLINRSCDKEVVSFYELDHYICEDNDKLTKLTRKNIKEKNMIVNSIFNDYKNKAIKCALQIARDKIKNKFGIEVIINAAEFNKVADFLEKYDSNFEYHIQMPKCRDIMPERYRNIIEHPFIVKLRNDTYMWCNRFSRNYDDGSILDSMNIYIFGKKSYRYYRILCKYLSKKTHSISRAYQISAYDGSDGFKVSTIDGSCRDINTLYFDNDIKQKITNHLNEWISNENIYVDRGIIYKTGILLYGTAGTGKSSLATAISTYLRCPLIIIDCTEFHNIDIGELTATINADTCRYVVLLDEIDSIFTDRDDIKANKKERTSKLLSFLDSPNSPTNVVFVATTNYIEKIDKAALRKGRFDLMIELTDIHKDAALQMCRGFNLNNTQIEEVLSRINSFPINPSTLQSIILEVKSGIIETEVES